MRFNSKKQPFEDYFWSRVRIRGSTQCWLWQGTVQKSGYVYVVDHRKNSPMRGRLTTAHRIAYELVFGPLEYLACHECDVRHCMSPYHLFDGTFVENMQDCIDKDRFMVSQGKPFKSGTEHPRHRAVTNWERVGLLRGLFVLGTTRKELHMQFPMMKPSHIDSIIYYRSWVG